MDPTEIKSLLETNNLFAKKQFGQNFLINNGILNKIVETADLTKEDTVLEIGPGLGVLTQELAKKAAQVISIEKDRDLIPLLEKQLKDYKNIQLINQDALKYDPPNIPYKIVANIPYYITSPLINHFLKDQYLVNLKSYTLNPLPSTLILLTQKEVADKICVKEGDLNVLALHIQTFGKPEIIKKVSKGSFYPMPNVDSAILKITPFDKPLVTCDLDLYFKIIHAGFAQKRKKIHNSLSHNLHIKDDIIKDLLLKANIDYNRRAETLNIQEWEALTNVYKSNLPNL